MRGLLGAQLLGLPVRLNGIELGRPVDLLLDHEGRNLVGIEMVCGDHAHRFVPLAAARVLEDEIALESAFTLIDDASFYRKRGRTLAALRGTAVDHDGEGLGALADVVLGAHGAVTHVLLEDGERVAVDEQTHLAAAA